MENLEVGKMKFDPYAMLAEIEGVAPAKAAKAAKVASEKRETSSSFSRISNFSTAQPIKSLPSLAERHRALRREALLEMIREDGATRRSYFQNHFVDDYVIISSAIRYGDEFIYFEQTVDKGRWDPWKFLTLIEEIQ